MSRVDEIIEIWSMRPAPNSPEGKAWEAGCRQGYEWATEHLRAAIMEVDAAVNHAKKLSE
jgi:hypothetical protein